MNSFKKYAAEFIGTMVLVLLGCGTAAAVGCSADGSGYLLTALAFGLTIVAMAYSIGNISGCHVNPAVSIAMLVSGKMSCKDFIGYVIAQCAGAIVGAALLLPLVGRDSGLGANALYNGSVGLSILIEVILTCIFVLAILGVTSKDSNSPVAGLVIGLSLTLAFLLPALPSTRPAAWARLCWWAGKLCPASGYSWLHRSSAACWRPLSTASCLPDKNDRVLASYPKDCF